MPEEPPRKTAKVVVLGDIGRSPRMQYHALSLANSGLEVKMIGYLDSAPLSEILAHPHITITRLYPLKFNRGPKLIQYGLKALWQAISLFLTLFVTGKCHYLLCQNPPAIPTLPICKFYCLLTRTKFVIDWHNYAFSIMALASPNRMLLKLATALERYFGQMAHHNMCVTYAMKEDLFKNWGIEAIVLYDRPPKIFHPITLDEKHQWFLKISQQYPEFSCSGRELLNHPAGDMVTKTAFTNFVNNRVEARQDAPGLLFSSTSWTPDEDFGILLDALQVYETTFDLTKNLPNSKLPKLICLITGKGPMKQKYIEQIASKNWQHIRVVTPWLEPGDYPTMVASADLGVCLHTSSSGLDLPMKVVDMFGAGLPVCAFEFNCIDELVENGVNGYTFKTADELSKQIVAWFQGFPNNEEQNKVAASMRKQLEKIQMSRWEDNWDLRVKKFFS